MTNYHEKHLLVTACWLRTNGVNTNGADAKQHEFRHIGEQGTPWHFWEYTRRLTGVPKKPLCRTTGNLQ